MNKDKQTPSRSKMIWTAISHGSILVYTTIHTILAPIGFTVASCHAKVRGDTLTACYYLLCVGLLIITTKEVDKMYAQSHAKLTEVINDSNDQA
jgi:hypothetical protein